jgi:hypothetical protein
MSAIVKRPFDNAFGAPGEAHSSPFRFGAASTPSHYVTATDIVTDDVDTSTASTATTNTTNNVLSHNNSLLLTPPPMAVAKRSRFHAPAEEGDEGENASAPTTPVAPTLRGNTPFRASGSRRSIGAFSVVPKKNFQNFLFFFFFFFFNFFFSVDSPVFHWRAQKAWRTSCLANFVESWPLVTRMRSAPN